MTFSENYRTLIKDLKKRGKLQCRLTKSRISKEILDTLKLNKHADTVNAMLETVVCCR